MPNLCSDRLMVRGSQADLDRFAATVAGLNQYDEPVPLRFGSIRPRPDGLDEDSRGDLMMNPAARADAFAIADSLSITGREPEVMARLVALGLRHPNDWSVLFWGTKWDLEDRADVTEGPGVLQYDFSTAWDPPVAWVTFASRRFPELSFELVYAEQGNQLAGRATAKAGRLDVEDWSADPGTHLRDAGHEDLWYYEEEEA